MRVLVVEDNSFNAFCLRRLLEAMAMDITVTIVNNSRSALLLITNNSPDMVIIDGDLGAKSSLYCNGPDLAHSLLQHYPDLPVIAWSDSESMRCEFTRVFRQHHKASNEYNIWNKVVNLEHLQATWGYYFGAFANQPISFAPRSQIGYR